MNLKVELDNLAAQELRQDLKEWRAHLKQKVFDALTVLEAQIIENIRSNAGLKVMSGRLLNSIGRSKKVREEGSGVFIGEIGPKGVPYAAIHEFGGTIVPTKAQALTIPTYENTRKDGNPKRSVAELFSKHNAFIANGMIFAKRGKGVGAQIEPMFLLKKSVTIPARPYMQPAIAQTREQIIQNFGLFLAASFKTKE